MRAQGTSSDFRLRAIAGTHVVLMAWDLDAKKRNSLQGFAIKRKLSAGSGAETWLTGLKYFASQLPDPKPGTAYSSREEPFQTFLWSDYEAVPGTEYTFTVVALFGKPSALEPKFSSDVTVRTEDENDGHHGVWFNRGVIASHAAAVEFQSRPITDAIANQVDAQGFPSNPEVKWLSRGLLEACIHYINDVESGEGLRVCAYEFTYPPILDALKRALDRGVDVQIVYHYTRKPKDENLQAIRTAKLPETVKRGAKDVQILFQRTRPQIPHNKFIVRLTGGQPVEVWTGSTNFTSTGFLGQTNVGHRVKVAAVAGTYLKYWQELSSNPTTSVAVKNAMDLTPNPPNVIPANSTEEFYSPRVAQNMLYWYADRISDAAALVMMTIPFNVAPEILKGLAKTGTSLRLVILENPPTEDLLAAQEHNAGQLLFSNGAILGEQFAHNPRGGAKVTPIPRSPLEKWFIKEEAQRPANRGHVFFVHSKILLIDPLSQDPLVCSGSANFSKNSLISNDENMLLIRGSTRVADIYLTEFDRVFRHFYARDVINRKAERGAKDNPLLLDETGQWIDEYYHPGGYKNARRLLFFPDTSAPPPPAWTAKAAKDPNEFKNQDELAKENRALRSKGSAGGGKKKTGKRKSAPKKATPAKRRKSPKSAKKKTRKKK